jgi:hypothetical protein
MSRYEYRNEWRIGAPLESFATARHTVEAAVWRELLGARPLLGDQPLPDHWLRLLAARASLPLGVEPEWAQSTLIRHCRASEPALEAHLYPSPELAAGARRVLRALWAPRRLDALGDAKSLILDYAALEQADHPGVLRAPWVGYDTARQRVDAWATGQGAGQGKGIETGKKVRRLAVAPHPLPPFLHALGRQAFAARSAPLPSVRPVPPALWTRLFTFQQFGVAFAAARARSLITDEMGLGKTLQGMACAWLWPEDWPVLTVCPAQMLATWKLEWTLNGGVPDDRVLVLDSTKTLEAYAARLAQYEAETEGKGDGEGENKSAHPGKRARAVTVNAKTKTGAKKAVQTTKPGFLPARVLIISLPLVGGRNAAPFEWLLERKPRVILLDEAHRIKNGDTSQSQRMRALCAAARHVVLLTGTPGTKPAEFYYQMVALDPFFWTAFEDPAARAPDLRRRTSGAKADDLFWRPPRRIRIEPEQMRAINQDVAQLPFSFGQRYCDPVLKRVRAGRMVWTLVGATRVEELHALNAATFAVRRSKREVVEIARAIPPKTRYRVLVEPPADLRAELQTQQEQILALRKVDHIEYQRQMGAAGRALVQYKLPYMLTVARDSLASLREPGRERVKVLWFAHNASVLRALEAEAATAGFRSVTIDGKKNYKQKMASLVAFQNDPAVRVIVLSITAANVGLTLTAGTEVIMFQTLWDPPSMLQAEDRVCRIGQTQNTSIYYVLVLGSVDMATWAGLQSKSRTMQVLVHGFQHEDSRFSGRVARVLRGEEATEENHPLHGPAARAAFAAAEAEAEAETRGLQVVVDPS